MNTRSRIPFSSILLLLLICIQAAVYSLAWLQALRDPNLRTADFISFYAAGRLARGGELHRLYDLEAQGSVQRALVGASDTSVLIFSHPPYLVPLLAAISVDDYPAAFVLWGLVRLAALIACGLLIHRLLVRIGWERVPAWLAATSCLLFFPVFVSLLGGQDTAFTLLGLLIFTFALLERREVLAGLGLALGTLAPTIAGALVLPVLAARRRAGLWFLAGIAGLGMLFFPSLGMQGARDFIALLLTNAEARAYGLKWAAMYNLLGLLARGFPRLDVDSARLLAWAAAVLAVLVLCIWWSNRRENLTFCHIGLAVTLVVFASPHLYLHALSFLLVPMLAFVVLLWERGRRQAALLFVPLASTVMMLLGFLAPALNFAASYVLMGALAWGLASDLCRTG